MANTSGSNQPHLSVRRLDANTWDDFAELVERNGGVFGGCWCMAHHQSPDGSSYQKLPVPEKRAIKEELVRPTPTPHSSTTRTVRPRDG